MATRKQNGKVLWPEGVQEVALPLAVRTMTVDGKRMTPAFYKQITQEELLDEETGDLRGTPLGFFHLHTKDCLDVPHQHMLWGTETQLHLAMIVSLQDDARYQKHAQASYQKQEQLIRLLILVLALADHTSSVEWVSETKRRVRIAEYTFIAASDLAERLEKLERARTQQKEDREKRDADEGAAEGSQAAETVLADLAAHGVEVAHSERSKITRSSGSYAYNEFSLSRGWHAYPRDDQHVQLYWRVEKQQGQAQEEHLRSLVETHLASPHLVLCVRSLLANQMLQEQRRAIRETANYFLHDTALPTPKGTKREPSEPKRVSVDELAPDQLWQLYQQESKRLKTYTEHWNQSLQECQTVEQLFLIS